MPKVPRSPRKHRLSPIRPQQLNDNDSVAELKGSGAAIWTASDDEKLSAARAAGLNWQPIASQFFPHKTANACRKRHERLMERRTQDDWDNIRLEELAVAYMSCRREVWSVLADRLGERWAVIEAKCMEKGIKNLQAISSSSQRRGFIRDAHHDPGKEDHEGDSGLGLSDAELDSGRLSRRSSTIAPVKSERSTASVPRQTPVPLPLYEPPAAVLKARRDSACTPTVQQSGCKALDDLRAGSLLGPGPGPPRQGLSLQAVLFPEEHHE